MSMESREKMLPEDGSQKDIEWKGLWFPHIQSIVGA